MGRVSVSAVPISGDTFPCVPLGSFFSCPRLVSRRPLFLAFAVFFLPRSRAGVEPCSRARGVDRLVSPFISYLLFVCFCVLFGFWLLSCFSRPAHMRSCSTASCRFAPCASIIPLQIISAAVAVYFPQFFRTVLLHYRVIAVFLFFFVDSFFRYGTSGFDRQFGMARLHMPVHEMRSLLSLCRFVSSLVFLKPSSQAGI